MNKNLKYSRIFNVLNQLTKYSLIFLSNQIFSEFDRLLLVFNKWSFVVDPY